MINLINFKHSISESRFFGVRVHVRVQFSEGDRSITNHEKMNAVHERRSRYRVHKYLPYLFFASDREIIIKVNQNHTRAKYSTSRIILQHK